MRLVLLSIKPATGRSFQREKKQTTTLFRNDCGGHSSSSVVSSNGLGMACVIYEQIESTKGRDGLFDRGLHGFRVSGVGLTRDRIPASKLLFVRSRQNG
jgi:hypothetical protein